MPSCVVVVVLHLLFFFLIPRQIPCPLHALPFAESHIAEFMNPAVPPHHLNDSFKKKEKETMDMLQESFVMLKQQHAPGSDALNTAWNNNINVLRNVFELASDKCQLDHPLCNRCSELVVRELEKRIRKNEECVIVAVSSLSFFIFPFFFLLSGFILFVSIECFPFFCISSYLTTTET